jgi:hypothetical protein
VLHESTHRGTFSWYYPTFLTLYQDGLLIDDARHLEPTDVDERKNVLWIRVTQGWHP